MSKYYKFLIAFLLGLILAVGCDCCVGQEPVQGPLTDAIASRIEKRIDNSETKAMEERKAITGLLDRSMKLFDELEGGRIKDRIEDRKMAQAQHAETVATMGSLRDLLGNLRDRIENLPAFDGDQMDTVVERRTGPIREGLQQLTTTVMALFWLVVAATVLFVVVKIFG